MSHLCVSLAGWLGVAAVFGFYAVSGYLMTSVLNQSYGFGQQGLGRYGLNRFLRILTTYWFVLVFAGIVVAVIPRHAFLTNYKLSMPREIMDWTPNLFIVGLLGNLAYLIFLCHWQVAAVMLHLTYESQKPLGGELWLSSSVFINLVALLVYFLVDKNVSRVRDWVRGKEKLNLSKLATDQVANRKINLSAVFASQTVGFGEVADRIWPILPRHVAL